jgi:hypothetical protein
MAMNRGNGRFSAQASATALLGLQDGVLVAWQWPILCAGECNGFTTPSSSATGRALLQVREHYASAAGIGATTLPCCA